MGRLKGLWNVALWIKGSALAALVGGYLVYTNYNTVRDAEYNYFDRKQPTETGFHHDPPNVTTEWETNKDGKIETYLVYKDNENLVKKKIPILDDLLPDNNTIYNVLWERLPQTVVKEDKSLDYLMLGRAELEHGIKPSNEELDNIIKQTEAIQNYALNMRHGK